MAGADLRDASASLRLFLQIENKIQAVLYFDLAREIPLM